MKYSRDLFNYLIMISSITYKLKKYYKLDVELLEDNVLNH